jgi:hypothetical protein
MMFGTTTDKSEDDNNGNDVLLSINGTSNVLSAHQTTSNNKSKHRGPKQFLPVGFCPSPIDVICGQGHLRLNHKGNISFRNTIDSFVTQYFSTNSKRNKSSIIDTILGDIRATGGKFVRKDERGRYYEVEDFFVVRN